MISEMLAMHTGGLPLAVWYELQPARIIFVLDLYSASAILIIIGTTANSEWVRTCENDRDRNPAMFNRTLPCDEINSTDAHAASSRHNWSSVSCSPQKKNTHNVDSSHNLHQHLVFEGCVHLHGTQLVTHLTVQENATSRSCNGHYYSKIGSGM